MHHVMEFRVGNQGQDNERAEREGGALEWLVAASSCPTSDWELWVVTEMSGRDEDEGVRGGDLGIWAPRVCSL